MNLLKTKLAPKKLMENIDEYIYLRHVIKIRKQNQTVEIKTNRDSFW